MTAFAVMLDTLHSDANMGVQAEFRRPPFTWQPVRVIQSQPTDMLGNVRAGTVQVEIRTSAITDTPQRGDEIRLGGTVYSVQDTERDILGLTWRLTLSEGA